MVEGNRPRLADYIAHAMIEQGYGSRVMWGDGLLNDVACDHIKGRMAGHPLDRIQAATNALERAPDLFRKRRVHAHDSRGRARVVRCFELIGTPRPTPSLSESTP